MSDRVTQRLQLITEAIPLALCVEPWASEHCLPANGHFVLEVEGPDYPHSILQILHQADRLVVYAWDGSDYRIVNLEGDMISDWTGNRVPDFYSDPPLR